MDGGGGGNGRSRGTDVEGGSEQKCVNAQRLGASEILSWKMLVGNAADRGGEGLLSICTYWLTDPGK